MKSFAPARRVVALLMVAVLLASPVAVLAKKGEKNFKRGMEYEKAQQWEKAAQEFALAVAAQPSETEYQLHYRRAVFNASQNYMTKGKALAEQGDFIGAYNAYRQAYGLDPVNDLAAQEMDRMLRLQREKEGANAPARATPTTFRGANGLAAPAEPADGPPARAEQLQNIQWNGDLEGFIRKLADELSLNVVFDQNFSQVKRQVNVRWKDITPARALDYIFLANGLFFQKLDRRTILVADQSKRPMYQQLVLRTFYLYNIKPSEARTLLTGALPANAGRQPQFIENATTNSITVRDTPENIRIIEKLLSGVDKDRAEVVMEVSIYEISRSDLLQIGNQIGNATTLNALGGIQPSTVVSGRNVSLIAGATSLHSGIGLLIPASTISAFQSKTNTRLLFSTQVHAFDDEKSSTRVGEKVPVQTASVFNSLVPTQGSGQPAPGGAGNVFGSGGFPVIQYEDVGLNLDFKPKVYPNQDVQVSMTIESKDRAAGPDPLTPIFTQRKIEGVARIPNGKTMMIASIAQDRASDGRAGLPLLGLIPILGRLFTTPKRDNTQSDIVITMTPRVLRAPEITPSDLEPKETGTMQTPQSPSLEALIRDAEREEYFAKMRALPTNQTAHLPVPVKSAAEVPEAVTFVPAPKALVQAALAGGPAPVNGTDAKAVNVGLDASAAAAATPAVNNGGAAPATNNAAAGDGASPNGAIPANENGNGATPPPAASPAPAPAVSSSVPAAAAPAESFAELLLLPERQELKVGECRRVMVFLKTDAPLGLAAATLRFDPKALAVRSVTQGGLAGEKAAAGAPTVTHSVDGSGVLVVSVAPAAGAQPLTGEGLLLVIEVEGLAPGETGLQFDAEKVHFVATDGRTVRPRMTPGLFKVTQ